MKRGQIHFHTGVTCGVCGRGEALKAHVISDMLKELHELGWHRTVLYGWTYNLCLAKGKKERKAD